MESSVVILLTPEWLICDDFKEIRGQIKDNRMMTELNAPRRDAGGYYFLYMDSHSNRKYIGYQYRKSVKKIAFIW